MKERVVVQSNRLTKKYGKINALEDVNITVKRGDIYGLVGNNGAGKTTFLKLLTGFCAPTSGEFTMLGASTEKELSIVRRRTGAIIENPGFYPTLTAKQNLEYYRIQRGIPGKEVVDTVLKQVGLLDVKNRKFKNMSLGMKQRLGLGLAIMGEPELLVLDEPINGLDPEGIIEIRNLLLKLNREKGITIIISSHILTELSNIATEYGFLKKGKLVEQISSEDLKEKCQSYLLVKTTETEQYTSLLESELEHFDYKVMPDNSIQIYGALNRLTDFSNLAANHNIALLDFGMKEINLENYYMSIMKDEK